VVRRRERDEGEREVAFESVRYANNAAFGDVGMGGDGLLDRTYQIMSIRSKAVGQRLTSAESMGSDIDDIV
jgi:hypothetical protein